MDNTDNWIECAMRLPDEGVVVQTLSPGGMESTLKRQGGLWFVPDGSMYVYYTPMSWRPAAICDAVNTRAVPGHTLKCDLEAGHRAPHKMYSYRGNGITLTNATFKNADDAIDVERIDM